MTESSVSELNVSRFYGVYLLCSQSPLKQYAGKCYVGFTVNPNRRINQHNRGRDYGGARKTSNRGPWKMVLIVHGFPNNIAALQFEWAWQQPSISTRLKGYPELRRKKPKESFFQYNFRILSRMLSVGPWNRLPLTVRWLEPEYEQDFEISALPPPHVQIASGKVSISRPPTAKAKAAALLSQQRPLWLQECHLCMQSMRNAEKSRIGCLNTNCTLTCHLICLANYMISSEGTSGRGHYIPIAGQCPLCDMRLTCTELLENKRKCDGIGEPQSDYDEEEDDDDFDDSDVECLETEEDSDRNVSSN